MSTHCFFMCHFPTIILNFFPKRGGLPSCKQSPPAKLKLKKKRMLSKLIYVIYPSAEISP